MYKLCSSRVVFGAALALMMALSPLVAAAAAQDDNAADGETPIELLTDGLDAVADHADDSARRIFDKLISAFPNSMEAARARRALERLDEGVQDPEVRAAIHAENLDRSAQYRHAFLLEVGDRVFFAEDSSLIGGRARNVIENQARWLKARPDLTVTVIGRSDDGGTAQAGQLLSQGRAEAVRERLVASGVDSRRIRVESTGREGRLATCGEAICKAQNRTAEVYINDLGSSSLLDSTVSPARGIAKTSMGAELDLER